MFWLHGDHLGSASLTTNSVGGTHAQLRYTPYGQERWASGAILTDYRFTDQRSESSVGLLDYDARMYSLALAMFISPDSIVPNPANSQDWNRYGYVRHNPMGYRDSSGHAREEPPDSFCDIAPQFCAPSSPPVVQPMAESANVQPAQVQIVVGPGGVVMASGSSSGVVQKIKTKGAQVGGELAALLAGAAGAGGGAGGQALREKGRELTGQWHHVFSKKVMRALEQHPLGEVLKRNDLLVRAKDASSHNGYEDWHIKLDNTVSNWLRNPNNARASLSDFLKFMSKEYEVLRNRFPTAFQWMNELHRQAEREGK